MNNWITRFETSDYVCEDIGQVLIIAGDLIGNRHYKLLQHFYRKFFPFTKFYCYRFVSMYLAEYPKGVDLYHKFSDAFNFNFPKIENYEDDDEQDTSFAQDKLVELFQCLSEIPENGIFLVGEIEASLHINLQEKLISFMLQQRSDIQIICSTYSPSIFLDGWANCFVKLSEIKKQ